MKNTDHIYEARFKIRSYEVGVNQRTTLSTVANLFQEAAGLHAKKLNFDITDLHDQGLTWVLYKMHIRVNEFPARWEEVLVKTWPSTGRDIRAFRSYTMTGERGNLLAKALGQWMTLDLDTRRPRRVPDHLARFPLLNESDDDLDSGRKKINPLEGKERILITTVGKYDLDMNNHVNSVKYVDWSTGYHVKTPNLQCKELLIQHQAEALYGDKIFLSAENSEGTQKISLFNDKNVAISTAIATFV